jgi:uncharacterized protein (DUF433 family)
VRFSHPMYGPLAGTDTSVLRGRWHVTGTQTCTQLIEDRLEAGETLDEIIEQYPDLEHRRSAVIEIARLYAAYLAKIGRPLAA